MVAATAQAQCLKENEITEQDSLLLTRNLLRIAIFNITYIRGLFPESYFNDKSVPALEMKIKKLMPMDAESRRLIDWMEKGVYDALQKKYLRTLFFCISETETGPLIEEYAFSFSYCSDPSEISMNVNKSGGKIQGTTFKSKSVDFSPNYIRSCACKMVRTLVQLMRTLDQMPEERTIIMKLCYYDEVTPSDYEPPFFRCCGEEENQEWSRPPLKMKVGGVDSKHFMIALKVKSVLDPCEDENENIYEDIQETSNGEYSEQPGNEASETTLSETQEMKEDEQADNEITEIESGKDLARSHQDTKIEGEVNKEQKEQDKNLETVKAWLRCRHMDTVDVTDILSEFPEIPMEVIDDLIDRLVKQDLLRALRKDKYVIRVGGEEAMPKNVNDKFQTNGVISRPENNDGDQDLLYAKALYHVLPMDYVTIGKLQNKFDDEVNQSVVRKLIEKMSLDGYIESRATGNRRQGRRVIRSERARLKLIELQRRLHGEHQEKEERSPEKSKNLGTCAIDKDTSTNGRLHSLGSDLTRHGQSPQNGSKPHDFKKPASPAGPRWPAASRESTVKYGRPGSNSEAKMEMEEVRCSQSTCDNWEKRSRKTSMVKEPIYQCAKRLKSSQNPDFVN